MSDISTQIVSYVALAIAVGGMVVGVFNHKRIRSSCMGRTVSASLDIEASSPQKHDAPDAVRPSVAI
jgi:hypothetical protein